MPPHTSTLNVARETLALSEKSGDRTLKLFGLTMAIVAGLGTMLYAGHVLWRDTFGRKASRDHGRNGGQPPPAPDRAEHGGTAIDETPYRHQDRGTGRNWVSKARVAEPDGEPARAAHHGRHGPGRQH